MKLFSSFLDLLFPPKCPFCGRVLDVPGICDACQKALPWTEGEEAVRRGPNGFRCAAPLRYEGLAKEGLHRFKFRKMPSAAGPIGELIAQCAAEHFSGEFDTVTWVPVSARRLRQRGYDQARLLAESACGSGAMTRPGCWRRAPAACGTPGPFRCCARPSTTPPSRGCRSLPSAGPMYWASTNPQIRSGSPDAAFCWWTTSVPPGPLWESASGCCGRPGRQTWSAPPRH